MTASPSGPTPCKRYTVRWDRVLLALNLAGVIRSGTTRSGLSRRHAWTAGWANRVSWRRAVARRVGRAAGRGGAGGGAAARLPSPTMRPRPIPVIVAEPATPPGPGVVSVTG